jgi:hypothetical protein
VSETEDVAALLERYQVPAPAPREPLVQVRLVPVEVFGADEEDCPECPATVYFGYGLMDAVSAWSDCNRAIGRIYRVDESSSVSYRLPGETITVYVPQSEVAKLGKQFGDVRDERCPGCHKYWRELPDEHRARVVCEGQA